MTTPASAPFSLRRFARLLGLVVLLGTGGFWAAKGAHTGWSQNRVPHRQVDEITGIEFVTYEDRFVPGVEVLAAGLGLAAGLFAVSFFFNRNQPARTQ
jgi:hypothetical protein